ncbi:MAG: group II intron reverse transcriptase/maturase [Dehalococcoidia bacterium]|nr:group II intron reverse transcriptase/maturase [Dehalococcoidia bacterium]
MKERVKPSGPAGGRSASPAQAEGRATGSGGDLLERALEQGNLLRALKRVEGNRGAAGVDGMGVDELRPYLKAHWLELRERLLAGAYRPNPVRRVEIPKPDGGVRKLGIPTVLDRFLQQALLQVLTPVFDPGMSASSYGFRPGRSAHQAVQAARQYIREGSTWVVDLDLKQFFDHVNHDRLMARVAWKVRDRRVLQLIRRYLQSGVMEQGVVLEVVEGTPQGGPLSPLLANIYLDEMDKELEQRGHTFCRYADDCNIYVRSRRAGERVMAGVQKVLEGRLKLQVNEAKSAVDRPWKRQFLGFSVLLGAEAKIRLAPQSIRKVKDRVREITRRGRSQNPGERIRVLNQFLEGWVGYFSLAETPSVIDDLDKWLRHRLRACVWRQWRRVRTRYRELRALGLPERVVGFMANTRKGPWRIAQSPPLQQGLNGAYWQAQGLLDLNQRYRLLRRPWRTAGCGPARPVV